MAKTRDPGNEIIIRNLRKFREEAKLSTEEAAQASEISVDNIRRYETGRVGVPISALHKLGVIYGHKMDDFLMTDPPKADLAGRPVFHLRTTPGVEVDEKLHRHLQEIIEKANREVAGKRKK